MCGIAGIIGTVPELRVLNKMVTSLRSRGPDDEGYAIYQAPGTTIEPLAGADTDPRVRSAEYPYAPKLEWEQAEQRVAGRPGDTPWVALGNRRLAIRDLSCSGHQPMCNETGNIWLTFNGEIYNFESIRQELLNRGHRFLSSTDTEVIVHAYEEWGTACLERFNGMWGLALLDIPRQQLILSRDRLGIKPLYYAVLPHGLAFSSEIQSLLRHPSVPRAPNRRILYQYLAQGMQRIREETFVDSILQIPPATYAVYDLTRGEFCTPESYWEPSTSLASAGTRRPSRGAIQEFRALLKDAVALRLRADVPVGSCLSGGLDSSSVVCLAVPRDPVFVGEARRAHDTEAFHVFSARFSDPRLDEGRYIQAVIADRHVTAHDIWPENTKWQMDNLDKFVAIMDEPVRSLSPYAQHCIYRAAGEAGVRVTLDGQGGDELLGGYVGASVAYIESLVRLGYSPRVIAQATRQIIDKHPDWAAYVRTRLLKLIGDAGESLGKTKQFDSLQELLRSIPPNEIRRRPPTDWLNPDFSRMYDKQTRIRRTGSPFADQMYRMLLDPGLPHLLRFADRNSMAASVENRVPFLDHRLVEFAFRQPPEFFVGNGTPKRLLREAMKNILPTCVRTRLQKVGFAYPMDDAMRGDLGAILHQRLATTRPAVAPYVNVDMIGSIARLHADGVENHGRLLWRVLNADIWLSQLGSSDLGRTSV